MYGIVSATEKMDNERTEWFEVNVGVHQGSMLNPLMLAVALHEVSKDIRDGILKKICMLMTWYFLVIVRMRLK